MSTADLEHSTNKHGPRSTFVFLFLVLTIMVPGLHLLENRSLLLPQLHARIPVNLLLAFTPAILALVMTFAGHGWAGAQKLLTGLLPRRNTSPIWFLVSILLMPAMAFLAYTVTRLIGHPVSFPGSKPVVSASVSVGAAAGFFLPILLLAIGEELGWTGYATDPLQQRWGVFNAILTLGVVNILVHLWAYIEAGNGLHWLIGQAITIMCARIMVVWLFNHTGKSVLPAVLVHATYNFSYLLLGTDYDPVILAAIEVIVVCFIVFTGGSYCPPSDARC
jgi:uncharacterized protein